MTTRVESIIRDLDCNSVGSVTKILEQVKQANDLTTDEKLDLASALIQVFEYAHHTDSTLLPKLAMHTKKRIAKFGPEIIPFLFNELIDADSGTVAYFGQTIARLELPALEYILSKFEEFRERDENLVNMIQAVSYFKIPEAVHAIPLLIREAHHNNHQITAMSLYTLGRLVQRLKPVVFIIPIRTMMFDSMFSYLSNPKSLVRKNAARSLGKMLRKGLLTDVQHEKVYKAFLAITGKDENHNWDRAFIVRREAEDFLPYFHQTIHTNHKYVQSYKILTKRLLCSNTYFYSIDAPLIAKKIEAGQFIIIRPNILSERIPLSVCGWDRDVGSLDIIVSTVGKTTEQLNAMNPGESFQDVVGPLGERSVLPENIGTCVVIGGGYGTGAIIPTAIDLKNKGNKVIGIVGARTQENLIMTHELESVCDELLLTTNDGSKGIQGFVTDALRTLLEKERIVYVLAVGPVPMMKAVSEMTQPHSIATYVSLNAIMVDGTGMCGACRVSVGGETKFACFHGPDFDGHKVDFENLMLRQKMFVHEEQLAYNQIKT